MPVEISRARIDTPRTHNGPLAQAAVLARAQREPVFVPVQVFVDDRGWSLMNQFQQVLDPKGQINYSVVYPNVIKAWHRHQHQTDFWLCPHGHVKVGVHREDDGATWMTIIGEKKPGVMIIPPTLWHGVATVGHEQAGLLYYVDRQYNPDQPDEERKPFDVLENFPWTVRHR